MKIWYLYRNRIFKGNVRRAIQGKKKTGSPREPGNNLKFEGGVTGKEGKGMLVGQNLQVSNGVIRVNRSSSSHFSCVGKHKFDDKVDPEDEDYQLIMDSGMLDDEGFACFPKCTKRKFEGSDPEREKTGSPTESGKNLKCEVDVTRKEGKSMLVGQNLQVLNGVVRVNKIPSSHFSCVAKHKSNSEVDPEDADYQLVLDSGILDDEGFVRIPKGTKRKFKGSDSGREKTGSQTEYGSDLKSEDVTGKGKSMLVGQNLQVSDCIILPSNNRSCLDISNVAMHKCHTELQCNTVEEDYQEYFSSTTIDGENLALMPNCSVTKVYEEDGCSSSDSELVIMDSDPYHENTPFVSSKIYDSSWFADKGNQGDNLLVSANRDSQFRKGLMDILERPYDQGEYERCLQEITCQKPKKRHRETRSGKNESCPITGVNKSYLELHKDLKKAIDGAKEKHKVLFLLRGYLYWLEHLTQEGSFQPWLDASCLEMLTKM